MPAYPYGTPVENTFAVQSPTVDDLVAWLLLLPPNTKLPTDVVFSYDYQSGELKIQ